MNKLESSLVSVDWLYANLNYKNLVILNATLPKVIVNQSESVNIQIPNTRFFDIKNDFSDTDARFPNTLPSEEKFNKSVQKLGINNSSLIIVYDEYGIYSSARAWWLFKAFGHLTIAVLDGGFPAWNKKGFPVEEKKAFNGLKGNFQGVLNNNYFKFFNDILSIQHSSNHIIVDARSTDRFQGNNPEPRKELRSGHIPNSINLPYQDLLTEGKMKPKEELKTIFNSVNKKNKDMVFSCGSGVTACILALGAELASFKSFSVYDGSWTEYGTLTTD